MQIYIDDPQNPGQPIDVIELLKRDLARWPPPNSILSLMMRDKWTRHEALLILAGFAPRNVVDNGSPIGTIGAGVVYLDGTTTALLSAAGLQHPLADKVLHNYWELARYASGEPMDERLAPAEWLAWAESKGFRPYWLEYWREHKSLQESDEMYNSTTMNQVPESPYTPPLEGGSTPMIENMGKPSEEPFDPLPKAGIKRMFRIKQDDDANSKEWDKWFHKPKEHGLDKARGPKKGTYYPDRVGDWLADKGKFTRSRVNKILAKELPPRSEHLREMYLLET